MQRIEGQLAYVLHLLPYKETSGIVHFLTADLGRITMMARGVKRVRRGSERLQPLVTWHIWGQGRGEMLLLTRYQAFRYWPSPQAYAVSVSCLYLNELLMRLLLPGDPHAELFLAYESTLQHLLTGKSLEGTLRLFEKTLLTALGYGLSLTVDKQRGEAVDPGGLYVFESSVGPTRVNSRWPGVVSGESLWALEAGRLETAQHLQDAKHIMRKALGAQLGNKPLQSKRLWLTREKQQ